MDSLFPETPWSLIARAAGSDGDNQALLQPLLEQYWQPVFATVLQALDITEAQARLLATDFLQQLLQPEFLKELDPQTLRFRDVLRDRLLAYLQDGQAQLQRSQQSQQQWQLAEAVATPASTGAPAEVFDEQWMLLLMHRAVEQLRAATSATAEPTFEVFVAHDIEGERPANAELAQRLSIEPSTVDLLLYSARRQLRGFLIAEINQYSATQQLAREELDWLLT